MGGTVLDFGGKIIDEEITVYRLLDGQEIFCESMLDVDGCLQFDPRKALLMKMVPSKEQGRAELVTIKYSETMPPTTKVRIPKSSVLRSHGIADPALLSQLRGQLSGLILPGGHA